MASPLPVQSPCAPLWFSLAQAQDTSPNTTTALGRLDLLKETAERAPVRPRGPDALEPRLRDTLAAAGAHEEVIAGIAPVAAGAEEDL